ncbi:MAG: putative exosortase B-associated extracellular polysaccharide biosynthesis transporter EpsL [Burkholderiales bacterium]|nr:putative exosortase B-associated extracellular polysaccharide biosynthesis transporter EpsL [Burkholderiales bacterium]
MPCFKRPRAKVGRMLVTGVFACACTLAAADEFDVVNFTAGATMLYDDNVFRLSGGADPNRFLGTSRRDDLLTVTSAGIRINKPVSLQRFELDASYNEFRYQRFGQLSYGAFNYLGTWRWSVTPRFNGSLSTERRQSLRSFIDFIGFVRNLRTDETTRFSAEYRLDGAWRLIGGATAYEGRNSQPFLAQQDLRQDSFEGGVRYEYASGSFLSAVVRGTSGAFINRPAPAAASLVDTGFADRELEGRMAWLFSAKSRLDARLTWLERKHDNFAQRDYSGLAGNAVLTWGVSAKTRVRTTFSRDLLSFQLASSSYNRVQRVALEPEWQVSAKVLARARVEHSTREFLGPVAVTPQNGRVDRLTGWYGGVDWQPRRYVTLSASLQGDRRSSTVPGLDFRSTQAVLSAQFTF